MQRFIVRGSFGALTGRGPQPQTTSPGPKVRPSSNLGQNPLLKSNFTLASESTQQSRIVAIYPGSFDPLTNGHLDLIARGSRLADRLIVAVLQNRRKQSLFTVEERMEMLSEVVKPYPNVEVGRFDGLLVDYVAARGANFIIRGIRAISDYEYELQIAHMNRRLSPGVETVFLMAAEAYSFVSSQLVKEVASLGGNVSGLVPPIVEEQLKHRVSQPRP